MKERPILFSTPMVRAILAGNKTQTRRLSGLDFFNEEPDEWLLEDVALMHYKLYSGKVGIDWCAKFVTNNGPRDFELAKCPFGNPGDILWVRESYRIAETFFILDGNIRYKADDKTIEGKKYKPSIHMPKAAARIWLQIESVKAERLHEISEEDARAEGINYDKKAGYDCYLCNTIKHNIANLCEDGFYKSPVDSFQSLWQSINGEESWYQNPWVWVIKFNVISTTGKPTSLPTANCQLPTP